MSEFRIENPDVFSAEEQKKMKEIFEQSQPEKLPSREKVWNPFNDLANRSAIFQKSLGHSLETRADSMNLGKNDKGFPFRLGLSSTQWKEYIPIWTENKNEISPNLRDGVSAVRSEQYYLTSIQNSIASRGSELTDLTQESNKIQSNISTLQGQIDKIESPIKSELTRIRSIEDTYDSIQQKYPWGPRQFQVDLDNGWRNNQITWNNGRYITPNPAYTNVVNTLNEGIDYTNSIIDEYIAIYNRILPSLERIRDLWSELSKERYNLSFIEDSIKYAHERIDTLNKLLPEYQADYDKAYRERFVRAYRLEKSIPELQKTFENIFWVKYSPDQIRVQFSNAANAYGGLMEALNKWSLQPSQIKWTLAEYGKHLSNEEKMLFLNIMSQQSYQYTYNTPSINSLKQPPMTSLEDKLINLSSASMNNRKQPYALCTGISASISQVAKLWWLEAATVTVGQKPIWHAMSLTMMNGKYIAIDGNLWQDGWAVYTSNTLAWLLDTYAVKKEALVFTNYITDENGKILGQIRTPLNDQLKKMMFSSREISRWIENPSYMQDGVELEINSNGRNFILTNKSKTGFYLQLGYTEAEIARIKLETTKAVLGFEAGNENLRFITEFTGSKTWARFVSSNKSDYTSAGFNMWARGKMNLWDATYIEGWVWVSGKYQWYQSNQSDIPNISKKIWIPQTVELMGTSNIRLTHKPDISKSMYIWYGKERYVAPNTQSLSLNIDLRDTVTTQKTEAWFSIKNGGNTYSVDGTQAKNPLWTNTRITWGIDTWSIQFWISHEQMRSMPIYGWNTSTLTAQIRWKLDGISKWATWYTQASKPKWTGWSSKITLWVDIPL
jgi:hypothetical protein